MSSIEKFRYNATWYYMALVFAVLPLFFVNMYFNISQEKWLCFILCTIVYFFIMALSYIFDENVQDSLKAIGKNWGVTEYAMLAFFVVTVISTLFSSDKYASLTGNEARYNGLANIFAYFFVFIMVRKHYFNARSIVILLTTIGALVSTTAVCQYLTWDPIGMYKGVTVQSVHRMISTIGNRNIYASFLSIILPLTIYLYISCDDLKKRIVYGIFLAVGFAGGIAGNSDSFYIGVAAGLAIMVAAGGLTVNNFKRIPQALAWGCLGDYLILMAAHVLRDKGADIRPSQGITAYFTDNTTHMLIIFLVLAAISVILAFIPKSKNPEAPLLGKNGRLTATIIFLSVICCIFFWVLVSFPFPDAFGSYRGFIWRLSLEDFTKLSFFKQLFGYGPETLLNVYNSKYHDEMVGVTGVIYDNVHSEPLEYLVTTGILGFLAYMILVISLVYRLYKTAKSDTGAYLYLVPVFAYFAQSFVNIAQSATTPIYFLLIALAIGHLQPDKVKNLNAED